MAIGIIYATNSKMVRRIIATDNQAVLNDPKLVLAGESLLVVAHDAMTHIAQADALVEQATGKKPVNFRCALVVNGAITGFVKADPTIDTIPSAALVAVTDEIDATATYDAKTKIFTIPAKSIPAGTDKDGNPTLPVQIPAKQVPAVDPAAVIGVAVVI